MPAREIKYDTATAELKAAFEGQDYNKVNGITLGGNSYGTEACRWIAENVLTKWSNLKYVNFSNIFISRLKEDLPVSLKLMMDALIGKQIQHLDVSHNAFGPQGVATFEHLLAQASCLQYLDVSNCGLSPVGGQMIANSLLSCPEMKLKEFYGTRSRLEEEGL